MFTITIGQGVIIIITTSSLLAISQWLLGKWLAARLEKSIQHEYDKKLEDFRFQQLQRQKAEMIARLFAKWIKYRGKEAKFLTDKELSDFYEDLNRLSFEITLWLKDEKLLTEIMHCLQTKEGAKNIGEITDQIRKLILDLPEDKFSYKEITVWPKPESDEWKRLFGTAA